MTAYYNEIDPYAAQWLRNLIAAGHIAKGDVDERSIVDVRPSDLAGYRQCHFFAGIGGWSLALRLAGWADDRSAWTGSCPCQPFSAAGKNQGGEDERHLWPHWFRLIRECRPAIVFGEQVAAAIGWGWLDAVLGDLEAQGYAAGAAVLGAHSVGAPHIRQRLWFVADAQSRAGDSDGRSGAAGNSEAPAKLSNGSTGCGGLSGLVGHANGSKFATHGRPYQSFGNEPRPECAPQPSASSLLADARHGAGSAGIPGVDRETRGRRQEDDRALERNGSAGLLADADGGDASTEGLQRGGQQRQQPQDGRSVLMGDATGKRREGRIAGEAEGHDDIRWRKIKPDRAGDLDNAASEGDGRPGFCMADADRPGQREQRGGRLLDGERAPLGDDADGRSVMGHPSGEGLAGWASERRDDGTQLAPVERTSGDAGKLADAGHEHARRPAGPGEEARGRPLGDATGCGPWYDLVWLPCTDGKARPTQPGLFPLAHGVPARMGKLRAAGNAIVPQVAAEFIRACTG